MFGKKAPVSNLTNNDLPDNLSAVSRPEDKIIQEISVHKMPKDYKSGSFSYDEYFGAPKAGASVVKVNESHVPSAAEQKTAPSSIFAAPSAPKTEIANGSSKKLAIIIGSGAGVLVLVAAYFLVVYLMPKKTATPIVNNAVNIPTTPHVVKNEVPTTSVPVILSSSTIATSTNPASSTPVVVPTSSAPVISSQPLFDTDLDGLNDLEEVALGTNPGKADSDGDGYNDLAELSKLYNPSGTGTIDQDVNISKYTNPTYKYKIDYPKLWTMASVNKDASIIFTAADNSFIQVVSQPNDKKQNIKDWYSSEFSQLASDSQMIKVAGVDAVSSLDGLNIYFTDAAKKTVYVISYTPIDNTKPAYREIMQMMMATFAF